MTEWDNELTTRFRRGFANWIFGFITEVLFIILPFLVFGIVFVTKSGFNDLFSITEWSMGAAVLFGQSVIKMASGFYVALRAKDGRYKAQYPKERTLFLLTLFIVLGLAPSLVILTLVLNSSYPSLFLRICQVVLFFLGLLSFAFASVVEWTLSNLNLVEKKVGHSSWSGPGT